MKIKNLKQFVTQLLVLVMVFSFILSDYSFAKKQKPGAQVVVTKTDGYISEGELLLVKEDSILLASPSGTKGVEIKVNKILRLKVKKRSKILKGVLYGAVIGTVVGTISGLIGGGIIGLLNRSYKKFDFYTSSDNKKVLMNKLNKYARYKNNDKPESQKLTNTDSSKGESDIRDKNDNVSELLKKDQNNAKINAKRFNRFHLKINHRFSKSEVSDKYKKLFKKKGFGDTKPAQETWIFGMNWGSTESESFPNISSSTKSFNDFSLEYLISKKLKIGIGYSILERSEVRGYDFILLYDNYYSEMYLKGNFSGDLFYISGSWTNRLWQSLGKFSLSLGGAIGVTLANTELTISPYAYSGEITTINSTTFSALVFSELVYHIGRKWFFNLKLDYRYIPVKIRSINLSSEYLVDFNEYNEGIYKQLTVNLPESKIDYGGFGISIGIGFSF